MGGLIFFFIKKKSTSYHDADEPLLGGWRERSESDSTSLCS